MAPVAVARRRADGSSARNVRRDAPRRRGRDKMVYIECHYKVSFTDPKGKKKSFTLATSETTVVKARKRAENVLWGQYQKHSTTGATVRPKLWKITKMKKIECFKD